MPTSVAVCYCLTCVWATDPAWKVTAFINLVLHHPLSLCCCRGALPQHPVHSTVQGCTAPSAQNPQHGSSAEVPAWHTTHWYHYTSPVCHFSLSCANGCSHSPLSQHEPHWHMNSSQKPLAKPSLRHHTPLPPAYYNQCRKRNACIYVLFVLLVIAHSKRCSLGCRRRTSEQAEVPLPWQRSAGCCCPHRQSQARP